MDNDITLLRLKIEIDIDLELQHCPDAFRNMEGWSHRSDNLKLVDNVEIENENIATLSEDFDLCMAMKSRCDTGLEQSQKSFSSVHIYTIEMPPTGQILHSIIQPEFKERVT